MRKLNIVIRCISCIISYTIYYISCIMYYVSCIIVCTKQLKMNTRGIYGYGLFIISYIRLTWQVAGR